MVVVGHNGHRRGREKRELSNEEILKLVGHLVNANPPFSSQISARGISSISLSLPPPDLTHGQVRAVMCSSPSAVLRPKHNNLYT